MASPLRGPESLIDRNDSKNPSTTCRGITSSGRPCRRALAAAKASMLHAHENAALSVEPVGAEGEFDVMSYCWQHKEQANQRVVAEVKWQDMQSRRRDSKAARMQPPLQVRESIETLVERLGIMSGSIQDQGRRITCGYGAEQGGGGGGRGESRSSKDREKRGGEAEKHTRNHVRPAKGTMTQDFAGQPAMSQRSESGTGSKPTSKGFWAALCCVRDEEDYIEIVRHRKRTAKPPAITMGPPIPAKSKADVPDLPCKYTTGMTISPEEALTGQIPKKERFRTSELLSIIPDTLSPQTTSNLLVELSKPVSVHDIRRLYLHLLAHGPIQADSTP
nr:hypothetical protein CFP56_60761 [Quercus suber]